MQHPIYLDSANIAELDRLRRALTGEPHQELETLLSAPRHVRLINPSPRFANAVVYLPPPRVWPDALMDEWVLENIDTMAARIAVPSLVTILALEWETGSVHGHVCDLSVPALQALRRCAAVVPDAGAAAEKSASHASHVTQATHAWQLINASRHYASFDHRHAYADPELRMRMPPRWVPLLLPGVASDANDAVWSAVAKRPLDTLLSPFLPISVVDCADSDSVAGGLSLSALHADTWIDEVSFWALALDQNHGDDGRAQRDR